MAFDKVLVSPAKRAQMTCAIICAALHYDAAPAVRDALYFEGEKAILQCIRNVKSKHRTIAIVGHNPDFSRYLQVAMSPQSADTTQLHRAVRLQGRRPADNRRGAR